MSVLLDDKLPRHPKILKVSAEAAWFFVCGLCYCREHSPDGTIPNSAIDFLGKHRRPKVLAKELVGVVLWEPHEDGFRVHDYFDWNPTAEQTRAKKKKTAERVQRWRDRTYGNGVTEAPHNGVTNALVTPERNAGETDSLTVPFRSVPPPSGDPPATVAGQLFVTDTLLTGAGDEFVEAVRVEANAVIGLNKLMREDLRDVLKLGLKLSTATSYEGLALWLRSSVAAWLRACGTDARMHGSYKPRRMLDWLNEGAPKSWTFERGNPERGPKPIPPPPEMSKTQVAEREAWARDRIKPEDAKNIDIEAIFAPKAATR
jgi:hypothetical protein